MKFFLFLGDPEADFRPRRHPAVAMCRSGRPFDPFAIPFDDRRRNRIRSGPRPGGRRGDFAPFGRFPDAFGRDPKGKNSFFFFKMVP